MSGISQFFIEKMLSHSTENLHRGNPLCFTKFLEWKKFMDKRGGGGHQDFPSKLFCPLVPDRFVEESYCVSKEFWYPKMLQVKDGAGITIFRQKLLSHSTEKFRRGPLLCFTKFLVSEIVMDKRGDILVFSSKLFFIKLPKYFVKETFCVPESFGYPKSLYQRAEYQDLISKNC